jgi:hypothetical protein
MKIIIIFFLSLLLSAQTSQFQSGNIEFICMKTHKASNTCYFNFKVDGAKYTYVDLGCKKSKKKDETIKKIKEGDLALSRDWKIDCPEAKL